MKKYSFSNDESDKCAGTEGLHHEVKMTCQKWQDSSQCCTKNQHSKGHSPPCSETGLKNHAADSGWDGYRDRNSAKTHVPSSSASPFLDHPSAHDDIYIFLHLWFAK